MPGFSHCVGCVALASFAVVAAAQQDSEPPAGKLHDAAGDNPTAIEFAPVGPAGFFDRGSTTLYDVGAPSQTGGSFATGLSGWFRMADDLSFTPGPGAGGSFTVSSVTFYVMPTVGYSAATDADVQFYCTLYDTYVAGGQPPFAGPVLQTVILDATLPPGGAWAPTMPFNAAFASGNDNCVAVVETYLANGQPHPHLSYLLRTGVLGFVAGSSDTTARLQTIQHFQGDGQWQAVNGTYYLYLTVLGSQTPTCPWSSGGCIADYNGSGGTPDDADIAAFFNAWNSGDECADADQSGGTPDDADIARFYNLWNAGGC